MIQIDRSKDDFEYDIRSLVKAFYPKEDIVFDREQKDCSIYMKVGLGDNQISLLIVRGDKELSNIKEEADYSERKQYKNILKKMIYRCISQIEEKELPWGTLSGIRPVKIPLEKLENGKSDKQIVEDMKADYLCSDEKINLSLGIAKKEISILEQIDYKNGYSIYIGIPFCPSTCLYCSFTSYSIEAYKDYVEEYLKALFKEVDYASGCFNKKLTTVYIGGGTPTTLNESQLERLLIKIRQSFDFTYVKEFTVEAGRPDSITLDKLKILKTYGVSRISINPQTMKQRTLDIIGRRHTVNDIINAYNLARNVGHDNINMDIILGLPSESLEDIEYTLEMLDKLGPDSITVHTLAVKRAANLNIYKEQYKEAVPSDTKAMLNTAEIYMNQAGYMPYYLYRQKNMNDNLENVGYSFEGKEGIYNILIMEEKQTIVALGAGASSKFVFLDEEKISRVENVKSIKDYVERIDEMINRKKDFLERNYR